MLDRLIELLCRAHHNASCVLYEGGSEEEILEEEARYLLENGVIVLPCKIGSKLYDCGEFFFEGCSSPEIYELKDDEMTIHKRPHDYGYRFTYDSMYIGHDDIGKTVFFTREEAEQALKGGEHHGQK